MKSFILAVIALVVVAAGASFVLNGNFQKNADQAYVTSGARIH
jgi:hypothetical protein